jgi:hypothetical protein
MAPEQPSLIPDVPPEYDPELIPLKAIQPPAPCELDPAFVRSIDRLGVVERVKLKPIRRGEYTFAFEDGRRRYWAAKQLGHINIRAEVKRDDVRFGSEVVQLAMNAQRSDNDPADLAAIERLKEAGCSEDEITEATGVPKQRQRALLRYAGLEQRLRAAFDQAKIGTKVAAAAVKLTQPLQAQCADHLTEHGSLTKADVEAIRRAAAEQTEAFEGEGRAWKPKVLKHLRGAVAALPEAEEQLMLLIGEIIETIEPPALVRDTE